MEKLGMFNDHDRFFLHKGDHTKIFTHFKNFYVHKIQHAGSIKKMSRDFVSIDQRDMHKPHISEKTSQMADNKRRKQGKEGASLVEILLVPQRQKDPEWLESEKKKYDT